MNYGELFISAITALRSNLMRTALTMLGIVIGIASVILIISLGQGASASITSQVASLGSSLLVVIPGSEAQNNSRPQVVTSLKYRDAVALADGTRLPSITTAAGFVATSTKVVGNGQDKSTTVQGVGASYAQVLSLEVDQGEFITEEDENGLTRVAVLGPDVVKDFFGEDANPIGQSITIGSRSFRIIGVTKAKGSTGFTNPDQVIYVPVTTAMKVLLGQDFLQAVYLEAADPKRIDDTMEEVKQFMMDQHKIDDVAYADFTVRSSKDALSILNSITGILTGMLAGIAAISLVVGGIGIMNIMLVTVTERTKEIGLLKAIGAKYNDILTQFLIESIVLTVSGGIVGIILGVSLDFLITRFAPIPFVLEPFSIILAVGVSTIVGITFGIYPARKAAKLSPIDALRFE